MNRRQDPADRRDRGFPKRFADAHLSVGHAAVTLLEILIATSILAALMVSIIGTFRGGSNAFQSGQWRVVAQKNTQRFLVRFREILEQANHAETVIPNGQTQVEQMPLYVNAAFLNATSSCNVRTPILFGSVCKSYVSADDSLNIAESRGEWSGISLHCWDRKLFLKRNGSITVMNSPFPTQSHFPAGGFDSIPAALNLQAELEDVEEMRIRHLLSPDGAALEISIVCRRYSNGKPTNSFVNETIRAKLLNRDHPVPGFSP